MPASKRKAAAVANAYTRCINNLDDQFDEAVNFFDTIWDMPLGTTPATYAETVMRHLVRHIFFLDVQHATLPTFFFQNDEEFEQSRKDAGQPPNTIAFTTGNEQGGVGCGAFIHFRQTIVNTGQQLIRFMAHELAHWWLMRIEHRPDWNEHGAHWLITIRMFYTVFDGHLANGRLFPRTAQAP